MKKILSPILLFFPFLVQANIGLNDYIFINGNLDNSNQTDPYRSNFLFKNDKNNYVKYFNDKDLYRFANISVGDDNTIKYIKAESFYQYKISNCYNMAKKIISKYSTSYKESVDRKFYNKYSFQTSFNNIDIDITCSTGYNEDYSKFALISTFKKNNLTEDELSKFKDITSDKKYKNENSALITDISGIKVKESISNYNYIDTYKLSLKMNISKMDYFYGQYILNSRSNNILNFDEVSVDDKNRIKEIYLSRGPTNNPLFDLSQEECFQLMVNDLDRIKFSAKYFSYYEPDSQNYNIGKLYGLIYKININNKGKQQIFKIYCHSPLKNGKYTYQKALYN